MNVVREPRLNGSELKARVVDFAKRASVEITTHEEGSVPELLEGLAFGTTIYVAHTPGATLDQVVRVARKVEASGFRASPHIVARRLQDDRTLKAALRSLRDGGVEQVLLVAGDRHHPVGNFSSTFDLLDTGYLVEHGFKRIGVCGHPEGNSAISETTLWRALKQKQEFADRSHVKLHIVTQFGFDPEAICAWDGKLKEHGISLPVHVGLAGPTPLPLLIKFAMQCGIGASLRALMRHMSAMSNITRLATSPDEMVIGLLNCGASAGSSSIVQPHFFSLGGAVATLGWLRAVAAGAFEMPEDEGKFVMNLE